MFLVRRTYRTAFNWSDARETWRVFHLEHILHPLELTWALWKERFLWIVTVHVIFWGCRRWFSTGSPYLDKMLILRAESRTYRSTGFKLFQKLDPHWVVSLSSWLVVWIWCPAFRANAAPPSSHQCLGWLWLSTWLVGRWVAPKIYPGVRCVRWFLEFQECFCKAVVVRKGTTRGTSIDVSRCGAVKTYQIHTLPKFNIALEKLPSQMGGTLPIHPWDCFFCPCIHLYRWFLQ